MVQTKRLQVTLGRLTVRSQDPRTLGETWLKKPLWDRYHKHWVLGMKYSRCVLIRHLLHFRLSPSASAGVSHSSRSSQALGTLAWPSYAVGPAPKEQQGGIAEILPFLSILDFFGLYLFPKWGFIFKRSVPIKLNPQLQLCTAASCQSHKLLHKSVLPAKPRAWLWGLQKTERCEAQTSPCSWWMQLLLATARLPSYTTKFQKKGSWTTGESSENHKNHYMEREKHMVLTESAFKAEWSSHRKKF